MPIEVHEHEYDDAGRLVRTVITRESMWDDESRGRALRLAEYESGLCSCGCGLPRDIANQPIAMDVDTFTCFASRAIAAKKRADQDEHEKKGQKPPPPRDNHGNPVPRWDDGLNYYVVPKSS